MMGGRAPNDFGCSSMIFKLLSTIFSSSSISKRSLSRYSSTYQLDVRPIRFSNSGFLPTLVETVFMCACVFVRCRFRHVDRCVFVASETVCERSLLPKTVWNTF